GSAIKRRRQKVVVKKLSQIDEIIGSPGKSNVSARTFLSSCRGLSPSGRSESGGVLRARRRAAADSRWSSARRGGLGPNGGRHVVRNQRARRACGDHQSTQDAAARSA